MCGIAGYASNNIIKDNAAARAQLQACLDDIKHRGPDDSGISIQDHIILGHRRLSILDLSAGAKQPFHSSCGRYSLTFNGEIYNYIELKAYLKQQGINHYTTSDTEVLLNLLIKEGKECLSKLNGMFAFAFYDNISKKLLLARDRFGKKPIFYCDDNEDLIFCSELYPLRHFDTLINRELNLEALSSYFSTQFIDGNNTIYQGIQQLPAASYLIYEAGQTKIHSYWQLDQVNSASISYEDAKKEFSSLLLDAIKIRMRSDVPLGSFLSGGLDSSVITRLMLDASDSVPTNPVNSFSMGFDDPSYDESPNAITMAKALGTTHTNTMTTMSSENIKDILKHLGEPMADPSVIPFWELCKITRQHVTVALSGDGADEILGGYKRYLAANTLAPLLSKIPYVIYRLLDRFIPENHSYYGTSILKQIRLSARLASGILDDHRLSPTLFLDREKAKLLPNLASSSAKLRLPIHNKQPLATQMMLNDIAGYMKNDILVKVDSMSMAHSLEVRSPFLDYRLVEFVFGLPQEYKIKGSVQKRLLKDIAKNLIPQSAVDRPKHGFAVPVSQWLASKLKDEFIACLEQAPDFISRDYVNKLFFEHCRGGKDHGLKLWSIYIFLLWHKHYRF